jgi:F-type H+-transporting ATPase subunit delta
MPRSNVARRYAQGLFQLAESEHAVDRWRGQLDQLESLLNDDVLRAAFANPSVTTSRRLELAKRLAPGLAPQTQNLLRLLVEHRRTADISEISREFDRMANEAAGIVDATLTTAVDLTDADRKRYEEDLARRLNRKVRLEHRRDPSLIGGATVQFGDRLIDGSVRTQLAQLRQRLVT